MSEPLYEVGYIPEHNRAEFSYNELVFNNAIGAGISAAETIESRMLAENGSISKRELTAISSELAATLEQGRNALRNMQYLAPVRIVSQVYDAAGVVNAYVNGGGGEAAAIEIGKLFVTAAASAGAVFIAGLLLASAPITVPAIAATLILGTAAGVGGYFAGELYDALVNQLVLPSVDERYLDMRVAIGPNYQPYIVGTEGADELFVGAAGVNTVIALDGDDNITVAAPLAFVEGGKGNDRISAARTSVVLTHNWGDGVDSLIGMTDAEVRLSSEFDPAMLHVELVDVSTLVVTYAGEWHLSGLVLEDQWRAENLSIKIKYGTGVELSLEDQFVYVNDFFYESGPVSPRYDSWNGNSIIISGSEAAHLYGTREYINQSAEYTQIFNSGGGDDVIFLGAYNNVINYNLGDGKDRINLNPFRLGLDDKAIINILDPALTFETLVVRGVEHGIASISGVNWDEGDAILVPVKGNYGYFDYKINLGGGGVVTGDYVLSLYNTGTEDADQMYGTSGNDVIYGHGGDDWLDGGLGDDVIHGGAGNDQYADAHGSNTYVLERGWGQDWFTFGALEGTTVSFEDGIGRFEVMFSRVGVGIMVSDFFGNALYIPNADDAEYNFLFKFADESSLTLNDVKLLLAEGTDQDDNIVAQGVGATVFAGAGNDRVVGTIGDDFLDGGAGWDRLYGGLGNDTYVVDSGGDVVVEEAGQGHDTIISSVDRWMDAHVEELILIGDAELGGGNELNNKIIGNDRDNKLYGMEGDDWLLGGNGNDMLFGGDGADVLEGQAGDDRIWGDGGDDRLLGGEGDDFLSGGDGADLIEGGQGDDEIWGGDGDDLLYGGEGNDLIFGASGNDFIVGGAGSDTLYGDQGDDVFLFERDGGVDQVFDTQGNNKILMESGIGLGELSFYRNNNDLIIRLGLSSEMKVSAYFSGTFGVIEFSDGTTLSQVDLEHVSQPLGTSQGETLYALPNIRDVYGLEGDDNIVGTSAGHFFSGGKGDDVLNAFGVDNVFYYEYGDGVDTISIGGSNSAGVNLLNFGTGIQRSQVSLWKEGDDLIFGVEGGGRITISGHFLVSEVGELNKLTDVVFADGSSWENFDVDVPDNSVIVEGVQIIGDDLSNQIFGGAGDDFLVGMGGDDLIWGGAGNDILVGGQGNDTYVFLPGDGQDVIAEEGGVDGEVDVLLLDFDPGELWFSRNGSTLDIDIIGTTDRVSIWGWYEGQGGEFQVERMETGAGHVLLSGQVQALVDAMASFGVQPSGAGNLTTSQRADLDVVIAATWQ